MKDLSYVRPRTKQAQASASHSQPLAEDGSRAAVVPHVQHAPVDGPSLMIERLEFSSDPVSAQLPRKPKEGSEHLYARLSELPLSPPPGRNLQGVQSLYLGESWLLTHVVRKVIHADTESDASSPSTLHVPLPESVSEKPHDLGYDTRLDPEEMEILNIRGAFVVPERSVSDKLVRVFFECVYPAFPIFDRQDFATLYESNQLSLLILHAVCAISSTLCDEDVITEAGFEDRNAARKVFLKRAKALHDADYETNKVTLVQATFLLSFLWNGSTDEKDMFYWLSIAIGNAQGKGMHRT